MNRARVAFPDHHEAMERLQSPKCVKGSGAPVWEAPAEGQRLL